MFHVKRRRDKVRSISSGAVRRISIPLPCPSASPRDPLRWAPVGAPSAQSPLHFIRRCAPDIHSTPLSLRFPTRPAPLGSRGGPICTKSAPFHPALCAGYPFHSLVPPLPHATRSAGLPWGPICTKSAPFHPAHGAGYPLHSLVPPLPHATRFALFSPL